MTSATEHQEHLRPTVASAAGSEGRQMKHISWFFVIFSLLAALFLFALDNTVVANIQPSIIYTLGEIDKLPWISVAFALGAISTNLIWCESSFFDEELY